MKITMKLITKELEKRFKEVGSQQEVADPIVIAKFFGGARDWFATEYNPADKTFFGYVSLFNDPMCNEWGYFSLAELEEARIPTPFGALKIERDLYIGEMPISEMKKLKGIH